MVLDKPFVTRLEKLLFFLLVFFMFAFEENASPPPFDYVLCLGFRDFSEALFPSHVMMCFERQQSFPRWVAVPLSPETPASRVARRELLRQEAHWPPSACGVSRAGSRTCSLTWAIFEQRRSFQCTLLQFTVRAVCHGCTPVLRFGLCGPHPLSCLPLCAS